MILSIFTSKNNNILSLFTSKKNSGGYNNLGSSLFYFQKSIIPQNQRSYLFLLPKNNILSLFTSKKTAVGMVKLLVKKRLFGGNIIYLSKNGTPPLFVKTFGMTSEISVRGMVGLTLVRKDFKCFNFYSIDIDFVVV